MSAGIGIGCFALRNEVWFSVFDAPTDVRCNVGEYGLLIYAHAGVWALFLIALVGLTIDQWVELQEWFMKFEMVPV